MLSLYHWFFAIWLIAVIAGLCFARYAGTTTSHMISDQAVWRVVETYAGELGLQVTPHDLRRTYAKLAHKGGAAIEQISLNLGHANIQTTERYLGVDLDLQNAPSDYIDLTLE